MPLVTAQERVGTTLAKKYRLDRILGEGGMGVVFAGYHVRLDRKVAVKFLHAQYAQNPQVIGRFFSEAQAAARMQHPNVVDVYDVDQTDDDGSVYMVLEYLEGEPLSAFLQRRGPIADAEAIELMSPVLDALERAHEHGIIHRDLKPDNIFLVRGREGKIVPKVLDFGIAKLADANRTGATSTGQIVGTPAYMAPEQAMGRKDIGPWTDVWSMGVVLYEMLSGKYPFDFTEEMSMTAMLVTVITTPARPLLLALPSAPPQLAMCIDRALAKEPVDRWQSMKAFRAALEGTPFAYQATVLGDSTGTQRLAPPVATSTQPSQANVVSTPTTPFGWDAKPSVLPGANRRKSRLAVLLGGVALVGVLAIGVGIAVTTGGASTPPAATATTAAIETSERVTALPAVPIAPLVLAVEPDAGLITGADTPSVAPLARLGTPLSEVEPVEIEPVVPGGGRTTKRTSRHGMATTDVTPHAVDTAHVVAAPAPVPDTTNPRRDPPQGWGTKLNAGDM